MGLFDGFTKGVKRGLEYIAQFVSSFVWASEHVVKDPVPLNELLPIAKQFVSEALDVSGNLLPNIVGSLLTGGDPFKGSRLSYQIWKAHWKH